jgi:hypothetical protein
MVALGQTEALGMVAAGSFMAMKNLGDFMRWQIPPPHINEGVSVGLCPADADSAVLITQLKKPPPCLTVSPKSKGDRAKKIKVS